jgi:hypothetical protein
MLLSARTQGIRNWNRGLLRSQPLKSLRTRMFIWTACVVAQATVRLRPSECPQNQGNKKTIYENYENSLHRITAIQICTPGRPAKPQPLANSIRKYDGIMLCQTRQKIHGDSIRVLLIKVYWKVLKYSKCPLVVSTWLVKSHSRVKWSSQYRWEFIQQTTHKLKS